MYVKDYHHDYLVHQKEVDLSQWKLRLCFWSWYLSKFTFPTIIFKSSRSNDQVAAGKFHRSTLILQFYLFSTFKKTFVTQYRAPESKEPQNPWVNCAYLEAFHTTWAPYIPHLCTRWPSASWQIQWMPNIHKMYQQVNMSMRCLVCPIHTFSFPKNYLNNAGEWAQYNS